MLENPSWKGWIENVQTHMNVQKGTNLLIGGRLLVMVQQPLVEGTGTCLVDGSLYDLGLMNFWKAAPAHVALQFWGGLYEI